ncbi:MAG: glycosyltransferase family 39 protein [Anaerolineae bacterium]
MQRSTRSWLVVLLVLFIVTTFQLININALNMHPDEELSYRATNGTLADTLYFQTSVQDNQAPLWFVSFWAWRALVGNAEFTSRMFGLLWAMLALALTTQIARRAFGRWDTAGLTLAVLLGNAFFFTYALDIRPYPLVMMVASCSTLAIQYWLAQGTRRSAAFYGLSIAAMLYAHYLLAFVVLAHVAYVLVSKRLNRQLLVQAVLASAVGLLMWLPWLPTFLNQVVGLKNIEAASGTSRGIAGIGVSTQATTLPTIVTLIEMATNELVWLYALVLIIGLFHLWRHRGYRLALTWAVLTPAIYLLVNSLAAVYAPRFVSHALLGLALVMAAGLMVPPAWWRRVPVRALAVFSFVGLNLLTFPTLIPARIPYRELFQQVSDTARPGDVVLLDKAGETDPFQQFLYQMYLTPELNSAMTTDPQAALPAQRVWFITAHWLDEDVQSDFKKIEHTHPLQDVYGQCIRKWCYLIQLLQAPPLEKPLVFSEILPFYGMDQVNISSTAISARLWWKVDNPPSLDYSIGLHLLDANGKLVAQTDGSINHFNTQDVPTSFMQPDQIYVDYRTVNLPDTLPPGTYSLSLVVYQSWDDARLILPDGSDHTILQSITIP